MQDQLDIMKEIISSFLQDNREGKKKLLEWFLNAVMEEEARIQRSLRDSMNAWMRSEGCSRRGIVYEYSSFMMLGILPPKTI